MLNIMPEENVRIECQTECQNRRSENICHYILPDEMSETMKNVTVQITRSKVIFFENKPILVSFSDKPKVWSTTSTGASTPVLQLLAKHHHLLNLWALIKGMLLTLETWDTSFSWMIRGTTSLTLEDSCKSMKIGSVTSHASESYHFPLRIINALVQQHQRWMASGNVNIGLINSPVHWIDGFQLPTN